MTIAFARWMNFAQKREPRKRGESSSLIFPIFFTSHIVCCVCIICSIHFAFRYPKSLTQLSNFTSPDAIYPELFDWVNFNWYKLCFINHILSWLILELNEFVPAHSNSFYSTTHEPRGQATSTSNCSVMVYRVVFGFCAYITCVSLLSIEILFFQRVLSNVGFVLTNTLKINLHTISYKPYR